MRKYIVTTIFLLGFALILPSCVKAVVAGYNDVTFSADTTTYLSGLNANFTVSGGSEVKEFSAGTNTITLKLLQGSHIIITSSDRYVMNNSLVSTVCEPSQSSINIGTDDTADYTTVQTIIVTPSGFCSTASGGGAAATDTLPPAITGISVTAQETEATISWATDESSISWVVYGTSTNYASEIKSTSYNTSHSVTLTGLTPGTTYHYQIKSKDSSGNIGTHGDLTFTTKEKEAVPASTMTVEELKAKIADILAQINTLRAELAKIKGGSVYEGIPAGYAFTRNLKQGMVGDDVKYLQIILNSSADTRLASTGVGSPGNETNYFGLLTKAAVIKLQEKYADTILAPWGLDRGTGFVGSTTREKLNSLLGQSS